jgi:hypothetical protein
MEIYVTRYALTEGIQKKKACRVVGEIVLCSDPGHLDAYFHRPDWHETLAEAKAHAEKMRVKKIASLEKQLERLKALNF